MYSHAAIESAVAVALVLGIQNPYRARPGARLAYSGHVRARAKTDATQAAIVTALRAAGYLVQILATVGGGVPDLLVGCPWGELVLVECKAPSPGRRRGELTPAQVAWHHAWRRHPVVVVGSALEAFQWLQAHRNSRERALA
jgi:hypothetical protein